MTDLSRTIPCPSCGSRKTSVTDSRPTAEGFPTTKRRRQCDTCAHRFTTIEVLTNSLDGLLSATEHDLMLRTARSLVARIKRLRPNAPTEPVQ